MNDLRRTISPRLMPRRPQELRRIRIGGKGEQRTAQGGGTYLVPVKYDHFVVSKRIRGADENFETDVEFHDRIGDLEPRELRCRLGYASPDQNFRSSMVIYDGKKRGRTCDGERALDEKSGEILDCTYPTCGCKPYGHLAVMLEGVEEYGGFAGFRTTSFESINNIQAALESYYQQFGTLAGIPFKLVLYEREVAKGTAWSVGLVIDASPEEARRVALELLQLQAGSREMARLPAPIVEMLEEVDVEEEEDIEEEFFPPEEAALQSEPVSGVIPVAEAAESGVTPREAGVGGTPAKPAVDDDAGPAYIAREAALRAGLRAALAFTLDSENRDGFWEYLKEAKNVAGIEALTLEQLERLSEPESFDRVIASFKASPFYQEDLPF